MIETQAYRIGQPVPGTELPKAGNPDPAVARDHRSTPSAGPVPTDGDSSTSGRKLFLAGSLTLAVVVLGVIILFAGSWLLALVAVIPISLLLYVAISQILARFIQPTEDLLTEIQRVAAGDFERSISLTNTGEVGKVASSFNLIVRQLRDSNHRLSALGESLMVAQTALTASDELKLSYDNLLVVSELGQQIIASLKLEDVAMKVYQTLNTMMDAAALELASIERAADELPTEGNGGTKEDQLHVMLSIDNQVVRDPYHVSLSDPDNFAAWSLSHGREVFLDDVENNYTRYIRHLERPQSRTEGRSTADGLPPFTWAKGATRVVRSLMVVPMFSKGSPIGIIAVGSYRTGAFSQYHLDMVKSLALYVAVALDNASAYQKLNRALTDLTQAQHQLVQSEKMSSLGLLTAGIAHEINNPINFVSANVNPLRRNLLDVREILEAYRALQTASDLPASLAALKKQEKALDLDYTLTEITALLNGIEEGAKRTAEIVQGLRNFARTDENAVKYADIHQGLDSTLTLLANKYRNHIEIVKEYADLPDIECYPGQLNQVFMNILSNAIQAIDGSGTITIRTARVGNSKVEIRIRDTGGGMPEEVRKKIFDPFYTTKDVGVGTGLGLSISYGIIEKHGGSIEVDSEPGVGSEFIIRLPLAQPKGDPS